MSLMRTALLAALVALWAVPATAQERKFVIGGGLGVGNVGASVSSGGVSEALGSSTALATDFRVGYQPLPELALTWSVRALIDGTGATNVWGLGTDFAPSPNTLVRTVVGRASIVSYDDPVSVHGLGLSLGVEHRIVGPVYVGGDYFYGRYNIIPGVSAHTHSVGGGIRFVRR